MCRTSVRLLLVFCISVTVLAQAQSYSRSQIAAGKYLVEDVAICSSCHTPHDHSGALDRGRWLMGSRLEIRPARVIRWASEAPQIAGLPKWEDDEIVILLTTGKLETGVPMRAPMPAFHMTEQDARSVVAYLRSLQRSHVAHKKP